MLVLLVLLFVLFIFCTKPLASFVLMYAMYLKKHKCVVRRFYVYVVKIKGDGDVDNACLYKEVDAYTDCTAIQ